MHGSNFDSSVHQLLIQGYSAEQVAIDVPEGTRIVAALAEGEAAERTRIEIRARDGQSIARSVPSSRRPLAMIFEPASELHRIRVSNPDAEPLLLEVRTILYRSNLPALAQG